MRELGDKSDAYHADLAEPVLASGAQLVLLVGEAMASLANALEGRLEFVHVADAATARDRLATMLAPGDTVLVKGSHGVGLDRTSVGQGKRVSVRVDLGGRRLITKKKTTSII